MSKDSFGRVQCSPSVSRAVNTETGTRFGAAGLDVQPLGTAIRVDTVIPTRISEFVPASRLIWVLPSRGGRPVRALVTLLLTN